MLMKKCLLLFIMALQICHGLNAQNTNTLKYFNLVMSDNSLISYELTEDVDIHFQDSIMMVNDLNFYMGEGVKYFFSENDINDVMESSNDNGNYVIGDKLFVKSKTEGVIIISDMMGRVVFSQPNSNECVVDLSNLAPNTLYIIKINNQSIKFVKR